MNPYTNNVIEINDDPITARRKNHRLEKAMVFMKNRPVSSDWQEFPVSC